MYVGACANEWYRTACEIHTWEGCRDVGDVILPGHGCKCVHRCGWAMCMEGIVCLWLIMATVGTWVLEDIGAGVD